MDFFFKCALFLCAFIPLYILIIIKTLVEIIFGNLHFNFLNTTMVILLSMLTILGLVGFYISTYKKKALTQNINISSCKNITDQHFLNYFSLFVLFAITFDLSKVSYNIVFIIILCFIAIVYIKNELYHINPFLNIIGFSFYEITFNYENNPSLQHGTVFSKHKPNINAIEKAIKSKNNLWFINSSASKEINNEN